MHMISHQAKAIQGGIQKLTGQFKHSDADATAVEVLLRSRIRMVVPKR
jgi:hypothetical protein